MPQFIAAAVALLVSVGIPTVIATFIVNIALTWTLLKAASLLTSSSRNGSGTIAAQQVTVMDTVAPGAIVYGETRTSGVVNFYGTSGNKNQFLWFVIELAYHQVEKISDIWLDGIKIVESDIDAGTGLVSGGSPAWNGKLYIWKHLGTNGQTVDTNLSTAFPTWDSNHRGRGIGYIVVRMERDPDAFPNGAPRNFYARVRGRRIYDPRLDSTNGGSGSHRLTNPSTWAWSNNSVLCAADYLTGGCKWFDLTTIDDTARLGMKQPTTRIDWAQVAADATKCDDTMSLPASATEKRYVCNGVLSTLAQHADNMTRILSTCDGNAVYTGGKIRLFCGQYVAPTLSFGDNDLAGEYEVQTSVGANAIYNAVSAVYTDATRNWQPNTSYLRTNSSYETADGGREPRTLDLPMVTSEFQAQRLCEIELRRSRAQTTARKTFGLNGFKLRNWDTYNWSNSELGYVNKVFRAFEWNLDPQGPKIVSVGREEFSSIYADLADVDYGTPSTSGLGNQYELPDAPASLSTSGLANAIVVSWDPPSTVFPNTAYEVEESTSSSMSSPTKVYDGPDRQFTITKTVTTAYYYRVRAKRAGKFSDYTPTSGGVQGKASSVAAALSASISGGPATATVSGSSATTNAVTAVPTGGTSPYTYLWTFTSGGSGITITSNTAVSTTFGATGLAVGEVRTGIARVTVTDNVSVTYTVDVAVTITRLSMSVTASNVSKSKSGFSGSGTVSTGSSPASLPNTTPSGGTPAYTYSWVRLSTASGANPTISSSTAQNPTFSATVSDGTDSVSTWQVTVTDSLSATATTTILVTLVWNNLS